MAGPDQIISPQADKAIVTATKGISDTMFYKNLPVTDYAMKFEDAYGSITQGWSHPAVFTVTCNNGKKLSPDQANIAGYELLNTGAVLDTQYKAGDTSTPPTYRIAFDVSPIKKACAAK